MSTQSVEQSTQDAPGSVVLPFIREIRYQMDSCPGTNKSQFCFGGLAMLPLLGILDVWHVCFMVPGHTKFGPDDVARKIAGVFNAQDTFNQGMLLEWINSCATGIAYDGEALESYKKCTELLFRAIPGIMSRRYFYIVGDDGEMNIELNSDRGIAENILQEELMKLKKRSLINDVLPALREKRFDGIGSGSGAHGGPTRESLVPRCTSTFRRVRLFTKVGESEMVLKEHVGWCKVPVPYTEGLVYVNKALMALRKYNCGNNRAKVPYGAKEKQIAEMYAKYIPNQFVPDRYNVGRVHSSRARQTNLLSLVPKSSTGAVALTSALGDSSSRTTAAAADVVTVSNNLKPVRYSASRHRAELLRICTAAPYNGRAPKGKQIIDVASAMQCSDGEVWTTQSIKRAIKALQNARELT